MRADFPRREIQQGQIEDEQEIHVLEQQGA